MLAEHQTVDDLLKTWDSGGPVWTVELGGLGPGYEQALQVAAIEFARAGRDFVPVDDSEDTMLAWDDMCSTVLRKHNDSLGGLSGAQFGVAKWLAWQWVHGGGPEALLERARKESKSRVIQVSKFWPKASEN